MGCIASKQLESGDIANKKIEESIKKDRHLQRSTLKLLLIGPGESGKTTIFNQLKLLNTDGFTEIEKRNMKRIVQSNVLTSIQSLIKGKQKLGIPYEIAANEQREENILKIKDVSNLIEIKDDIQALWNDKGTQQALAQSNKFQLADHAKYFLDSCECFCEPDFVPSEDDIIRCRVKTSAIVEMEFVVDSTSFRIIDVGGQRNERKKWIHCFEGVTAVIYVTSLSEYNQTLFEDDTTNRMEESLKLFEEICNSKWFKNSHMILFFNKIDLFKEKISREDPKDYLFPNYTGGKNEKIALEYIKKQFLNKNYTPTKNIFTKETCAIDKNNIEFVFDSVKSIILQQNIENIFDI